jgi:hypothetical protein
MYADNEQIDDGDMEALVGLGYLAQSVVGQRSFCRIALFRHANKKSPSLKFVTPRTVRLPSVSK